MGSRVLSQTILEDSTFLECSNCISACFQFALMQTDFPSSCSWSALQLYAKLGWRQSNGLAVEGRAGPSSPWIADWNVSSVVLESGNASGAFLQTPTPILDRIPGLMDARFLSSVGLGFGTRIGRTQLFPTPALDKNRFPNEVTRCCHSPPRLKMVERYFVFVLSPSLC